MILSFYQNLALPEVAHHDNNAFPLCHLLPFLGVLD